MIKKLLTAILGFSLITNAFGQDYKITPEIDLKDFFNNHSDCSVLLEDGLYERTGDTLVLDNVSVFGDFNYPLLNSLEVNGLAWMPVTSDFPNIQDNILLKNSSLENIVLHGGNNNRPSIQIGNGNNDVSNCLIYNGGVGGIFFDNTSANISYNIIRECNAGLEFCDGFDRQNSMVYSNAIIDCTWGVYCAGELALGDVGEENKFIGYEGNNILKNRINIMNLFDRLNKAEGNWWYDQEGNLLTSEGDIQNTIINYGLNKSNSGVDVVPFKDYDYFEQTTAVENWDMY